MSDVPIVPLEQLLAHEGWIRGLARSLVLDEARADDVVQETWLTALRTPPRDRGVRAWLGSVVRSRAADARKSERRREAHETAASRPEGAASVVDEAGATEIHRRLTAAVMALDDPYRSAVILRFFEGLPPRDVGARTGVPAETARTRVNRGLDMLRARLDADAGGRRKWTALVLPLAGLDDATGNDGPSGTAGAVAMASAKTYVAAAVLALCVGAWWWLREDGAAATTPPSARVETTTAGAKERPPRAREEAAPPEPAPKETSPAAAPAAQPGARVRLRFVDEAGAPLAPEAAKARWGGGASPSVALFDDRQIRSADSRRWLLQQVEGAGDALRVKPLDVTAGESALKERVPRGRWRLVVFPGAAPTTLTAPFVVAKDGDAVDVDVVLAPTTMRVVHVIDAKTGAAVGGAQLTPYFEYGDDDAFIAGPTVVADASGEARVPFDAGDAKSHRRPPTWWATALGRVASFQIRPDPAGGDAPVVVRLEPTFDVEGEAFLADGSPAVGRRVSWRRKGMTIAAECDAQGRFRLAGLPASGKRQQLFLIEDDGRGLVRGALVETKPGETVKMRFGPPASDSARVVVRLTAGGRPVSGMAVTCRGGESGYIAQTDADGTATLVGLQAGAAPKIVVLLCDPRVADDFTAVAEQRGPLAAGETRRLTLDLPVGAVRVRVVAADGSPAAGALVVARPTDKSTLDPATDAATATRPEDWAVKFGDARFADDDGVAVLAGLPAGGACEISTVDGVAGLKASASIVPGTPDAPAEVTLTLK